MIRRSVCISKSQRSFWVSFSRMDSSLCIYHFLYYSFSYQHLPMVFHRSLKDSKSPQVSRTLLSIMANRNNDVFGWFLLVILFPSPLLLVPILLLSRVVITIGITVTFMFHSFFQFSNKVLLLILLYAFFQFYSGQQTRQFSIITIIIIIIIYSWEFFTSVLADGLSLEFEWQANLLKPPGLVSGFWLFSIM